jgi:hypothetical protein
VVAGDVLRVVDDVSRRFDGHSREPRATAAAASVATNAPESLLSNKTVHNEIRLLSMVLITSVGERSKLGRTIGSLFLEGGVGGGWSISSN